MCGRFALTSGTAEIMKEFNIDQVTAGLSPAYNIPPGREITGVINDGKNRLVFFRWGFIPFWAKAASIGSKMINARAETITEKPAFIAAIKKQRCLIVANGFYEWKKKENSNVPYYIYLKSQHPFGFAGLYDVWTSPEGEEITSCTIITTNANELVNPIHNRMPVIIPKKNEELWLDPEVQNQEELLSLLTPYPADEMEAHEVSPVVNYPTNNSPDCIKPV